MSNKEIAKMTEEQFIAACDKAKLKEGEKGAINTARLPLNVQLESFMKTSFNEEDEAAHHADAIAV
jgi:hypothetical protein